MGSCWYIFQLASFIIVAEALERLLLQRYVYNMRETSTQTIFEQLQVDPDLEISTDLLENIENAKMLYQTYRDNIKNGSGGKTAQFCITYMGLVNAAYYSYSSPRK